MTSGPKQFSDVGEVPGYRGSSGHGGRNEVGPSPRPLATLEIAVTSAGRALTGRELVRVHRQAHAATCLPPLGPRLGKNAVEPFRDGLVTHFLTPRHDESPDRRGDLPI